MSPNEKGPPVGHRTRETDTRPSNTIHKRLFVAKTRCFSFLAARQTPWLFWALAALVYRHRTEVERRRT